MERISGMEVLGAPLRRRDLRFGSWERTERRIVAGTPAHLYHPSGEEYTCAKDEFVRRGSSPMRVCGA